MPFEVIAKLTAVPLVCLLLGSGGAWQSETKPGHQQEPAVRPELPLDFETYRARIEPIFLREREGGARCYNCHSTLTTRLRLEPLPQDSSSWTEEQSRKNFAFVQLLITPGNPYKSRLLLHSLAPAAGGDPAHTGGKFWQSQSDPEWQMIADWVRRAVPAPSSMSAESSAPLKDALDFELFKSAIQPIFLKERPGHARCYSCHVLENRIFHLQDLTPGLTNWTDEQTRQNFLSASQLVAPGKPESSRLLLHPLAPESGGDAFHSGGRQFASREDPDWMVMAAWVRSSLPAGPKRTAGSTVRVYVTNSAGNTLDVIDPSINEIVQTIHGIELPHGVGFSPDGSRLYVSNEAESILDVVDRESGQILKKVSLTGRPNNLAVTRDGSRVLVGIRTDVGVVDVIDTNSLSRSKSIPVDGSVHNIFVTPDGKYAVSGSIENKAATVIDLSTEQVAWEVRFDRGVRPMAFESNLDGSTRRIFVQLSGLNGFAVVDFAKRAEVARIRLPEQPGGFGTAEQRQSTPSHGIGVAPDGKSLWVNSTAANAVFKYSLPDLHLIGFSALPVIHPFNRSAAGVVPEWITFTPDSNRLYISNSGARSISVIDVNTLAPITVIPVGEVPKRINTLVMR